jgi:amino acid transporter
MATAERRAPLEQPVEKGLKPGALGLVSTLPTARTTLSMAAYKALLDSFAKTHPRYMTPTVSTIAMGGVSIALYAAMNYMSSGALVIADAVIAIGLFIAFYYGLTGFACAWYYRKNLTSSARNLWMQGILPVAGGLMLYFLGGWSASTPASSKIPSWEGSTATRRPSRGRPARSWLSISNSRVRSSSPAEPT